MAKRENPNPPTTTRQRRREERFAKQQEQQLRTMRIIGLAILGLILLIVVIGAIIEFVFVPQQAVAVVNGTEIKMEDWRDQVRFQRAQLISTIDDNYELFHDAEAEDQEEARLNTIRTIQQFFGQQLNVLSFGHEQLGEGVLEGMISTELVRQEAAKRGINVSSDEVDALIGEQYSYFDGGLPTPFPTEEPTVQPTPSITPIPDPNAAPVEEEAVVEEEVPAEEFPTPTPRPTNTPVSLESFEEQRQEDLDRLTDQGVNASALETQTEETLLFRKLGEAIYAENGGTNMAPHVSSFLIVYATEDEAAEGLARIESDGFLQVWNEIRSLPPQTDNSRPPQAIERVEWTAAEYERAYQDLPNTLFDLAVGETSGIIQDADAQSSLPVFIIAQATSNQELELPAFRIDQLENEALQEWLNDQRQNGDIQVFENWKNRIPRQPAVDSDYLQPIEQPQQVPVGG